MSIVMSKQYYRALDNYRNGDLDQINEAYYRFQADPRYPGLHFEKIREDDRFTYHSIRAGRSIRIILARGDGQTVFLYVAHHQQAYRFLDRRHIITHPRTGVPQLVLRPAEAAERAHVADSGKQPAPAGSQPLFASFSDDDLVSLGLPPDYLAWARKIYRPSMFEQMCGDLPEEVVLRLRRLLAGDPVERPIQQALALGDFTGPEAERSWLVVGNDPDVATFLKAPWAQWLVFLHPGQKRAVESEFRGPARISGSAGTGKTVVAVHRARWLARRKKRVLVTTFVRALNRLISDHLDLLCGDEIETRKLITVNTIVSECLDVVREAGLRVSFVTREEVRDLIEKELVRQGASVPKTILFDEWDNVFSPRNPQSLTDYRTLKCPVGAARPGNNQYEEAWRILGAVRRELDRTHRMDESQLGRTAAEMVRSSRVKSRYDCVIVDEVQDLAPAQLEFLREMVGTGPDSLFLVGDGGQRIFRGAFSLRSLGIETRGRSHTLLVNYRTTEQIRRCAETLLRDGVDDMDGGAEDRRGTYCALSGARPKIVSFQTVQEETDYVRDHILQDIADGVKTEEICVIARTAAQYKPFERALRRMDVPVVEIKDDSVARSGIRFSTMHGGKGTEYRRVYVVRCSAECVPDPTSMRQAKMACRESDALRTERQLLYVSLTRARDAVTVTCAPTASRLLDCVAELADLE
jgi:hypothetical protein